MNSKERLLKALNFEEPDRPPIYASFTVQAEILTSGEYFEVTLNQNK